MKNQKKTSVRHRGTNCENDKLLKAYATAPLFDRVNTDQEVNLAIPSDEDVVEAKEWVDANKK